MRIMNSYWFTAQIFSRCFASQALQANELCDTEFARPELTFKIAQGTTSDLKPQI
jgi:hypothetical protein